jgi:hypothetical protein
VQSKTACHGQQHGGIFQQFFNQHGESFKKYDNESTLGDTFGYA